MCVAALSSADLLPSIPQPIRIERFVEKHFSCSIRYEDLGDGAMGCTIFREDGSIEAVVVSKHIDEGHLVSDRRVRSTLAHEGGHCLMHPVLFMKSSGQSYLGIEHESPENIDFERRRILCREGDIGAVTGKRVYNGRWWEWQANRAIGGFLLPTSLVAKACAPFVELSAVTNSPALPAARRLDVERELSAVFDVNPVVARIRLQELFPGNCGQLEF